MLPAPVLRPLSSAPDTLGPSPVMLQVSWEPVPGAHHYRIERNGLRLPTIVTATASVDSMFLSPFHSYSYAVVAVDAEGNESPPSSPQVIGPRQIQPVRHVELAVIYCAFNGWVDSPTVTRGDLEDDLRMMSEWLWRSSYRTLELSGKVHGVFELPSTWERYCEKTIEQSGWGELGYQPDSGHSRLLQDAKAAAGDLGRHDVLLLLVKGLGTVGLSRGVLTYQSAHWWEPNVLMHEIGHKLGAEHAGDMAWYDDEDVDLDDLSDVNVELSRYGGPSVMGAALADFDSWHKLVFGWLQAGQSADALNGGTFELERLERSSRGLKQLRIPIGPADRFWFIDFKQMPGHGPMVHVWLHRNSMADGGQSDAENIWVAALYERAVFQDTARGIRVSCTGLTNARAVVVVERS